MNILALNCGSSSVKFKLIRFDVDGCPRELASGLVEEVGSGASLFRYVGIDGEPSVERVRALDHEAAVRLVLDALTAPRRGPLEGLSEIAAVGHRVVHGGAEFRKAVLVDDAVREAIGRCSALAPLHNPHNLRGIELARALLPGVPQVAVFDTAFHQSMPPEASTYALPEETRSELGIRRYGFHGISHAYVARRAAEELGRPPGALRIVTCHLGNGASVAAVKGGRSVDTSMGMTPLEGLVMGTRCGDLDPAVVLLMVTDGHLTPDDVDRLLNERSGLLGLSGASNDMREVIERSADDSRAELALEVFCYRVRKYIGAYTAALGGIDALVFTGGIGENEPEVRARACRGLDFLGVLLDDGANERGAVRIGAGSVAVLVLGTDEELAIAMEAHGLVT